MKPNTLFMDILEELDIEPRSYSGRGMYGESCIGITTDDPLATVFDIAHWIGSRYTNDISDDLLMTLEVLNGIIRDNVRQDSMGRSMIIYWPRLAWPAGRG